MARKPVRNLPGSERFRDEQRAGGARMHGREWHDHDTPKPLPPEAMAGADAARDVEGSGVTMGMSKLQGGPRKTRRRKRSTPPGKGRRPRP